jgi:ABC-type Zn uptake system ZnuABC Zn-binding protein ZnuA
MRRIIIWPATALVVAAAVIAGGCGGSDSGSAAEAASTTATAASGEQLKVVATVSPLTNIVANVAGGLADVEGVVPEGENSHEFEPAPSVAELLSSADVIFINGLHLEEPTKELAAANLKDGAEIVELGNGTISEGEYIYDFSFPEEGGDPNPHLWTNPNYAKRYAEIVKDTLSERDSANADAYQANYETLAAQIDEFSAALMEASQTVPEAQRKLLTYHDSFPYFARDFGWTVIGAVQPSDFAEPTPKEVGDLIQQIEAEGIPAIFGSEVFPSPVLDQIANETGAEYVDDLRDDDLPAEPGAPEHSLLGLLQFDYVTIIEALGGDAAALQAVDTSNPVSDEAVYPQ